MVQLITELMIFVIMRAYNIRVIIYINVVLQLWYIVIKVEVMEPYFK